jgi:hypothetical protein
VALTVPLEASDIVAADLKAFFDAHLAEHKAFGPGTSRAHRRVGFVARRSSK